MKTLCLTCLSMDVTEDNCPDCAGRVISHPELFDLSIAHIDADAFYASIEKHDNPDLKDRPLIIGNPDGRSVVTTACYMARQYGVRSAQPMYRARQACPEAVVLRPRFERYREVSSAIRRMMEELTPMVMTVSLDEAYLDLTGTERLHKAPPAVVLARLSSRVRTELGVTISVGLSHAPYLAKIASDLEKPNGFSLIGRSETADFLADKPVGIIGGVGGRMQEKLAEIGIRTIGDIRRTDPARLQTHVGSYCHQLFDYAFGRDSRKIAPNPPAKSISAERTFEKDIYSREALTRALWPLCEKVSARAKRAGVEANVVTLRFKQEDHRSVTRQASLKGQTNLEEKIFDAARGLIDKAPRGHSFRLLGVGLSELQDVGSGFTQTMLFDEEDDKREAAERVLDQIRDRWGREIAFKGRRFS